MRIGVLALQGAFREHLSCLDNLGINSIEVRTKSDLESIDGIILPGGESTAMMKLLHELDLKDSLIEYISKGLPTWGTCAGMILLSESHLAVMNIDTQRNAYGNQSGSFMKKHDFGDLLDIPMVFIRAPIIKDYKETVEVLSVVDDKIVAAREKNVLATAFHPELTDDLNIHKYFIQMIRDSN